MKPSRDSDQILLRHMLECLHNIDADCGRDRAHFFASRTVRDAVLRNLQILTESSQRLSDDLKATERGIPWRQMSAMRNILVHDYLGGIDPETVWETIERDLPTLRDVVERMLARWTAAKPEGSKP